MIDKLVNWIVDKYIGTYLTGHNTKFGAAATTILAVITALGCFVEPLQHATEGNYMVGVKSFDSQTFMAALAGLTAIKMVLGTADKIERAAPPGTQLHAAVVAEEVKRNDDETPTGI